MKNPSLFTIAATGLGIAVALFSGQPASANEIQAFTCHSRITLPTGKEELTLFDVKHAIKQHLARTGAPKRQVKVTWDREEFIYVDIFDQRGKKLRRLIVDAAMAQIVINETYLQPVGFTDEDETGLAADVAYRRKLRRHMLGDGKPWADWIINSASTGGCFDDYRFGGPDLGPGS